MLLGTDPHSGVAPRSAILRTLFIAVLSCAALAVTVLRSSGVIAPAGDAALLLSENVYIQSPSSDDGIYTGTLTIDTTNEESTHDDEGGSSAVELTSLSQKGRGTTLTSCRAACNCTDQGSPVLAGADVVEYFALDARNTPLQGSSAFAATYKGFQFHFLNDDNRATFMADPSFYAPQLGGFCAYGIASEFAANGFEWSKTNLGPPVSPAAYRIYDKRLFLFISEDVIQSFEDNGIQDSIDAAQGRWVDWFGVDEDRPYNSRCVCSIVEDHKDCHN